MIKINLIDTGEKKTGKAPAPGAAPGGGGGGGGAAGALLILVALGLFGGGNYVLFSGAKAEVDQATKDLESTKTSLKELEDKIADKAEEAKNIRELYEEVKIQSEVLAALDPDEKILWSQKLAMLSQLVPQNVFLNTIEVEENVTKVEVASSVQARTEWEEGGRKGPRPETMTKPVVSYNLILKGMSTGDSDHEQWENIKGFHDAMIEHKYVDADGHESRFMDLFNPEIGMDNIKVQLYERQYPVTEFTFTLHSKIPQPPEPEPAKKTPAPAAAKKKKAPPKAKH